MLGLAVDSKLTRASRSISLKEKGCEQKKMMSFMRFLVEGLWKVNHSTKTHKSDEMLIVTVTLELAVFPKPHW